MYTVLHTPPLNSIILSGLAAPLPSPHPTVLDLATYHTTAPLCQIMQHTPLHLHPLITHDLHHTWPTTHITYIMHDSHSCMTYKLTLSSHMTRTHNMTYIHHTWLTPTWRPPTLTYGLHSSLMTHMHLIHMTYTHSSYTTYIHHTWLTLVTHDLHGLVFHSVPNVPGLPALKDELCCKSKKYVDKHCAYNIQKWHYEGQISFNQKYFVRENFSNNASKSVLANMYMQTFQHTLSLFTTRQSLNWTGISTDRKTQKWIFAAVWCHCDQHSQVAAPATKTSTCRLNSHSWTEGFWEYSEAFSNTL